MKPASSKSRMNVLLCINEVVAERILDTWLTIVDVATLDSAFCNRSNRLEFQAIAYCSATLYDIPEPDQPVYFTEPGVVENWTLLRQCRIATDIIDTHSFWTQDKREKLLGPHVRVLHCDLADCSRDRNPSLWTDVARLCTNLERISVYGTKEFHRLTPLCSIKRKYADFTGSTLKQDVLTTLLRPCRHLNTLLLNKCPHVDCALLCLLGEWCPDLEELGISETIVDEGTLAEMLVKLPELRRLDASYTNLGDMCMQVIAKHCPHMDFVDFESTSVTEVGVLQLAKHCPLRKICFGEEIDYRNIKAILAYCGKVTEMDLATCDFVDDEDLAVIAKHCPLLSALNLNDCIEVSDDGVTEILKKCPMLRMLYMSRSGNYPPKQTLQAIARHCPLLTTLHCDGCASIRTEGLRAVATHCRRLQYIRYSTNIITNPDQIRALFSKSTRVDAEHDPDEEKYYISKSWETDMNIKYTGGVIPDERDELYEAMEDAGYCRAGYNWYYDR